MSKLRSDDSSAIEDRRSTVGVGMAGRAVRRQDQRRQDQIRAMAANVAALRNVTFEKDTQKQRRKNLGVPYKSGKAY